MNPIRGVSEMPEQCLDGCYQRFSQIIDSTLDAIVMIDGNGSISLWNQAAEKVFGYTAAEALGKRVHSLVAPSSEVEEVESQVRDFNLSGQGMTVAKVMEIMARNKDGLVFPIELSLSPFRSGDTWSAIGIIRDVTEKRRMLEEIIQAQKLECVGGLAGGIAHDFNNLLQAITGSVEILKRKGQLSESDLRLVNVIDSASRQGMAITNKLLSFVRRDEACKRPQSLNAIIDEVYLVINSSLGEVQVQRNYCNLPPIIGDSSQIAQVVMNLCLNARDAMVGCNERRLTIATQVVEFQASKHGIPPGKYVRLKISDTGCGIPADIQERMFEPFFTTKKADAMKGTGLGMALVKDIINMHGGFIRFQTEVGQGTDFFCYFPIYEAVEREQSDGLVAGEDLGGQGTVLVIDDDEMIREVLDTGLSHFGYTVLEAADGEQGLALFADNHRRIGLVIMDLEMPGLQCDELLKSLKDIDDRTPIIVSSGKLSDENTAKLFKAGVCECLAKPFSFLDLIKRVHQLL